MIKIHFYAFLLVMISFAGTNVSLAQDCQNNSIRKDLNQSIYISDFRVSLEPSDCPGDGIDLSEPIVFGRNESVQFWFRMQGSREYLKSISSQRSFEIRFFRLSGNSFVPFDVVSVGSIRRGDAAAEAAANDGRFDWRIWVRKQVFFRPGNYSVAVYQDGGEICLIKAAGQRVCTHEFKVR